MNPNQTITTGDSLEVLRTLEAGSVDSIVTDPPYALGFMGKGWDKVLPDPAIWRECLRVAKPGAMLLAFGGTRTYHRLTCAIEDAGWEIRDCLSWLYGSGFPKSLDVSKAIDKLRDDVTPQTLEVTSWLADQLKASGKTHAEVLAAFSFNPGSGQVSHWTARTKGSQPAVPTLDQVPRLLEVLGVEDPPDRIRHLLLELNGAKGQPGENWWKREKIGRGTAGIVPRKGEVRYTVGGSVKEFDITAPATDAARTWEGYGTALKPAWEPIVLAMKPLDGTFAKNALEHGVAGLNVDGCRVDTTDNLNGGAYKAGERSEGTGASLRASIGRGGIGEYQQPRGRFPANVILDEEAAAQVGDPSRFFYCAKASKKDRTAGGQVENRHPTVKPTELMRWLVRLCATPTGGLVLDPFAGSGSTGVACVLEGRSFLGIELEPESAETARARIEATQPD